MLLKLIQDLSIKQPRVTIEYGQKDRRVDQLIEFVEHMDRYEHGIMAAADGRVYRLRAEDVLYIESVDRKTFCYTQEGVYELSERLYEVEAKYAALEYMRISKSCIINLRRIQSLKPEFGGKILALMDNGEKLIISRQYATVLKEKLGLGGGRR